MRNFYEMIGTSENAIKYKRAEFIKNKNLTDEQIDELLDQFIREKYENAIKLIKMKQKISKGKVLEQRRLEQEKKEITYAYQQIASNALRDLYSYDREEKEILKEQPKQQEKKIIRFNEISTHKNETAYHILGTLEETINFYSDQENDRRIKERVTRLLKSYAEELEKTDDFRIRVKLLTMIKRIEESYESIKTAEKRKEYGEQLRKEREERDTKNKYCHADEYIPSLIYTKEQENSEDLWSKMLMRKKVEEKSHFYKDEEARKIEIRKIGEVHFLNANRGKIFINEYEITRQVEEEERKDIIYTNSIQPIYLSIHKQTGEPIYPEYYNCVVNELLAEDSIEGSKYNGGYIGEVQKDEEGNYYSTLRNKRLRPMEQEYLTAVMMLQKREKMKLEEEKGAEK